MPQDSFIRLNKNNNKINIKKWRLKKYKIPMIFYDLGMHVHSLIEFLLNSQIKKSYVKQTGSEILKLLTIMFTV